MKRAVPFLLSACGVLLFGIPHVFAATQSAGTLDEVNNYALVAQSGGPSNGSEQWVEQDVTSTFTGTISSFSVIIKGGYSNSGEPLMGSIYNNASYMGGIDYYPQSAVCDDSQNIGATNTDCIVNFQLDQAVTTTAGDVMTMRIDTQHNGASNYNHFYTSLQNRDPSTFVDARIHGISSGPGFTVDWDDDGYLLNSHQFAWAWNYSTTTDDGPPPCTENCNDNILFLPGSEASHLYDSDGKKWEPGGDSDVEALYMDPTGTSTRSDIYTQDVIDESYFGYNIYKSFLDDLADWKNTSTQNLINDYAVVPYDWRLPVDDILKYGYKAWDGAIYYSGDLRATSTPYILEELKTLEQTSRTGKVTIVAHSYGGLVAKELLKQLEDSTDTEMNALASKVDNLVLVGVPQTGTPQAIASGLNGYDLGLPLSDFSYDLSPETAREFASTTSMLYELLPSEEYFDGSSTGSYITTPPVTFEGGSSTDIFVNEYGSGIYNESALHNFLIGAEERPRAARDDIYSPAILSPSLLAAAETFHDNLDSWVPSTSTQVYEIAGWGEGTVGSIEYETGTCGDEECANFTYVNNTPLMVVDGDNTVVAPSALAMSTSTSNVTRLWLNLADYNGIFTPGPLRKGHKNIFEVQSLRDLILNNIVAHSTTTLPQYITIDQPSAGLFDTRLDFFLHSPLALSAKDQFGNEINESTSTLPGAIYRRFGELQYISVPADSKPILSLKGYASGSFTLEAQEVKGDVIITTTKFSDIPCVTSTDASISFTDGTIAHASSLSIDHDGNGTIDERLMPKITILEKQDNFEFKN